MPKFATNAISPTFPSPREEIIIPATIRVGIHEPFPKTLGSKPSSPICLAILDPATTSESVTVKVAVKAENATTSDTGTGAPIASKAKERGFDVVP